MKKIVLILMASMVMTAVLSACHSSSECPAYASAETVVEVG